jgi:hypothetical protein
LDIEVLGNVQKVIILSLEGESPFSLSNTFDMHFRRTGAQPTHCTENIFPSVVLVNAEI